MWAWNCLLFPQASMPSVSTGLTGIEGSSMRAVLWLLALSAVAVAVTVAAKYNNGYVLMVAPPYRVGISLNLMVVLLLAAILIGYFIVRLIAITLGIPGEVREFRLRRRREKARRM